MKEYNFTISKNQKIKFDEISKNFNDVIIQINASINGFEIKLSSLGGKQKSLENLISHLKIAGIID
jgi:hypothetical protein